MIMFFGKGSWVILELSESNLDLGYSGDVAIEEADVPDWRDTWFPEFRPKNEFRALLRDKYDGVLMPGVGAGVWEIGVTGTLALKVKPIYV